MLLQRMIRAARLDVALYEEVEADTSLTRQAATVVAIVAVCQGLGSALAMVLAGASSGSQLLPGLVLALIGPFIGWVVWSYTAYWIGTRLFHGTATPGELLRTLGFAQTPGVLGLLSFLPLAGGLAVVIGGALGAGGGDRGHPSRARLHHGQGAGDRHRRLAHLVGGAGRAHLGLRSRSDDAANVGRGLGAKGPPTRSPGCTEAIVHTGTRLRAPSGAAGQALPLEQAIEDALRDEAPPAAAPPARDGAGGPLTRREAAVVALVAQGLSNRELAARLVITARTAENHVAHLLDRLGFRTRVQIAAWATERGLGRPGRGGGAGGPA